MSDQCPSCAASLIGDPVPEQYRIHKDDCAEQKARYGRCYCLPWGDTTHFRREIGHEARGVYDGILYWSCPDCGHAWHRWPEDHYLYQRAVPFVVAHRERAA